MMTNQDFPKGVSAVNILLIVHSNSNPKMLLIQTYGSNIKSKMYVIYKVELIITSVYWNCHDD